MSKAGFSNPALRMRASIPPAILPLAPPLPNQLERWGHDPTEEPSGCTQEVAFRFVLHQAQRLDDAGGRHELQRPSGQTAREPVPARDAEVVRLDADPFQVGRGQALDDRLVV